jgi:hypothetical protein
MKSLNYRVNFLPAIEISSDNIILEFNTLEEANQNLNSMAQLLLFMQNNSMMNDFSNTAWVEQFVDGEWEEIEDDEDEE